MSGIYMIINTINDKYYIGKAEDLDLRKRQHFEKLRAGKHHNIHLQRAFNIYGEENFRFEIIIECESNMLDYYEVEMISEFDATNKDKGYNMQSGGEGGKPTEEVRAKLSKSQIGNTKSKGKKRSEEYKRDHQKNSPLNKAIKAWKINEEENVVEFFSATEASRILGIRRGDIAGVLCGLHKTTKGYKFAYI